ncbi:MAG: transcriptional regulator [bacterium]|nr:transcriptional regulator [bacterium]
MALFSAADQTALSGLHVQRVMLAHVSFPSGERRLHTGMGPLEMGGETWEGVSDPFGGQLVGLTGMEEPRFGRAVAIDAVFSGANKTFLKSIWDDRHSIEGVPCDLYFAVIDAETGDVLIPMKQLMAGKLSAPRFSFVGSSIRAFTIKIVSIWEGLNFAVTGSMWSPAGQRARYPGDRGLDLINAEIIEIYK